jgi:hypothetical protein
MVKDRSNPNMVTLEDLATLIPKPPTGVCLLPSKGRFYNPEVCPDGKIELSPMSGRTEKLIAGIRGNNVDEVIDTVLRRCLVTKLDPDEMLITDRLFTLMVLRSNSYGEEYNFDIVCPSCEVKSKYTVNIPSDFPIDYAKDEHKEPFEVTLPVTGIKIGYKLLRGKDSKELKKYVEEELERMGNKDGDSSFTYRLAKSIVSVNGKQFDNVLTAITFCEKLPAKDLRFLSVSIEENTPGMLLTIKKDCSACGKKIETDLPITAEFFRPKFTK